MVGATKELLWRAAIKEAYETEGSIVGVYVDRGRTIFHELGHIMCKHTLGNVVPDHRGIREGEAEMTAYLCMKETGSLTEERALHSRGYLHHWMEGDMLPETSIRRIFAAVEAIMRDGRVEPTTSIAA